MKLKPRTIKKVYTTLSAYYGIREPRFQIKGHSKAYGFLEGSASYFGMITFYGLPSLETVLHEFYHYYYYGRDKYGKRLSEYLAEEFVDKWYSFFHSLLKIGDQVES